MIEAAVRWTGRNFLSFLVIVALLATAKALQSELAEFTSTTSLISALKDGKGGLEQYVAAKENEASERVTNLKKQSAEALRNRIAAIDTEIQQKKSAQRSPAERKLSLLTGANGFVDDLKSDAEIKLLEQEREYLRDLHQVSLLAIQRDTALEELERRRQIHVFAYGELKRNEAEYAQLTTGNLSGLLVPWSAEYQRRQELKNEHQGLYDKILAAHESYGSQFRVYEGLTKLKEIGRFEIRRDQLDSALQPLNAKLEELNRSHAQNWLTKLSAPVIDVIPAALGILLGIIFVPIGIKAFFYFMIAPAASRRPAVRLLPNVSGLIDIESLKPDGEDGRGPERISAVSMSIRVDEKQELLVHPEYLQSSSHRGEKDTKWMLDWSVPLSSLASGMVALMRIRATEAESFVISATRDPFSEIGVFSIAEGAAVVLQPHCLVGVVQPRDKSMRISRHWRLGSLNAWLTLQLRYLVFHGPARLIVKGCRGVRAERVDSGEGRESGRGINQAATIGFSANLAYSTRRCETFASYLMGKQELFNDSFFGGPGYYIYEETPHFGKKTGITGRGLEGISDSLLKVFGV